MSSMMHQMRTSGFGGASINGTLSFRCRVPAVDHEEQLTAFEDSIHRWLFGHLGDVGIEVVGRDAVRHGEEFELVVRMKVMP